MKSLQEVMSVLQNRLKLEVAGRGKTTPSISDKLRRESIRLSQMQDVAGCRVVCPGLRVQDIVLSGIQALFDMTQVMDRRERPSHGYRAVHVIVSLHGCSVEVQVRTALQHLWAELSEKMSDLIDPTIKYGGGPEVLSQLLSRLSDEVADIELGERKMNGLKAKMEATPTVVKTLSEDVLAQIRTAETLIETERAELLAKLRASVGILKRAKVRTGENDIPH